MTESGFFRAVAASPLVAPANSRANAEEIARMIDEICTEAQPDLIVFPEMCITGYTCADLFHNSTLLDGAVSALGHIERATALHQCTVLVGMPLRHGSTLYNCAVAISCGRPVAAVPKTYVPNYNEFYEKRWWAEAPLANGTITVGGAEVPFGTSLLLDCGGVRVGVEVCEDLWTPAQEALKAENINLEFVQFSDYVTPNNALANGEIDLNAFQHRIYLQSEVESYGYEIETIGNTFIIPLNIYSDKVSSVAEL